MFRLEFDGFVQQPQLSMPTGDYSVNRSEAKLYSGEKRVGVGVMGVNLES